jgi:hypothetical protein
LVVESVLSIKILIFLFFFARSSIEVSFSVLTIRAILTTNTGGFGPTNQTDRPARKSTYRRNCHTPAIIAHIPNDNAPAPRPYPPAGRFLSTRTAAFTA